MILKLLKKYPIVIMVIIYMVICYIKKSEAFTNIDLNLKNIPPSSIGPGGLCPMNNINKNKLLQCMNGFHCNNETFPDDDNIGICRLNTN